jgi:hypothetical protein
MTQDEIDDLYRWTDDDDDTGSRVPSMTYEQGIRAVLDVLSGECTVEDLMEG